MAQSDLKSFTDFIPAEVRDGKLCRIVYYAKEPQSGELKRVEIKCNRLKSRRANLQLARRLCYDLNLRLAAGYNPFVCRMADDGYTSMADALLAFQREKNACCAPTACAATTVLSEYSTNGSMKTAFPPRSASPPLRVSDR